MYPILLTLHSLFRYAVLFSLLYAIYTAYQGLSRKIIFTPKANAVRHWTATISHIQLILGMSIYFQSPVVLFKIADNPHKLINEQVFFRFVHIALMIIAIVIITVGSAKTKRTQDDREQYKTMLWWFSIGLLIILLAIPWPFSPLADRPLMRGF